MNGRNAPVSPVSLGGNEWFGAGKYASESDSPYSNNRGQLISPPSSGGSNGDMNGGYTQGPRSVGGPSPPPSVGRSSNGTNMYARSESGRSQRDEQTEAMLAEHYVALKRFLTSSSRDEKPNAPNKARDKLQRLSAVQFLELSTDVYDELMRRQAFSRRMPGAPPNQGPPPYLLPELDFHPKRNQARQKLSSLGAPRFRDLATDVFCELERRFPRFAESEPPRVDSPVSVRGLPSRSQTPVNGMNQFPPRSQSRMRRPSDASSIRNGGPPVSSGGYTVPPSPGGTPKNDYGRPLPKQFQSNTIVPNKSTMVEEDDDPSQDVDDDRDAFGLERATSRTETLRTDRAGVASDTDRKLIGEYQIQVRELREKLEAMDDTMKKREVELNNIMDGERNRATAANLEKKEWGDLRASLENKISDAQDLNERLQQDFDRLNDEHAIEVRRLREQLEEYRQSTSNMSSAAADVELQRENQELRVSLREQQQVTEEVRREAQEFLREMKVLSQQSGSSWERQADMEKTIEKLEEEVRDWRNRYARTKTQLRNLRASSLGLTIEQDASKYVREKGFTEDNGLVKDVHVTKFQISIDELLQKARNDDPERIIDAMKTVVIGVRRITKDIDDSAPRDQDAVQQQTKLKSRVSNSANNLITASKNFASSAGISPVSLLDAAASHLVAAIVELLRTAKIRSTPAGELEDDDDGTMTPVDSTGFFSPSSSTQNSSSTKESLPPPPPFQGLSGNRASADSSAYSPISSPRESLEPYSARRPMSRNGAAMNGGPYVGMNKNLPAAPNGFGMRRQDSRAEELKASIYLEDQTAILVQNIQNLVGSIRSDAPVTQISAEINAIAEVVGKVVSETEASGNGGEMLTRLAACRQRLLEAGERGQELASRGRKPGEREWRMWTQTLPPIAFEIARETKELVQRVDRLVLSTGGDEFA